MTDPLACPPPTGLQRKRPTPSWHPPVPATSPINLPTSPLRTLPPGKRAIQTPRGRPLVRKTSNEERRTGSAEVVSSNLIRFTRLDDRQNHLRDVVGPACEYTEEFGARITTRKSRDREGPSESPLHCLPPLRHSDGPTRTDLRALRWEVLTFGRTGTLGKCGLGAHGGEEPEPKRGVAPFHFDRADGRLSDGAW